MNIKRTAALIGGVALLVGGAVIGVAGPASADVAGSSESNPIGVDSSAGLLGTVIASTPGATACSVTDISANTVQGSAATESYQYSQNTTVWTVEHKEIQPNQNQDVIDWLGQIGGIDQGNGWWQIPDSVIASVHFNPLTVAKTGSVNVHFYGGPSEIVSYQITGVDTSLTQPQFGIAQGNTTIYWTDGAPGWTLDGSQASWTTTDPGAPWAQSGSKSNNDGTPDVTTYYSFTHQASGCQVPVPAQQCVSGGSWYSEDNAPVQGEDGLDFTGQNAAVDYYHPVTGNLQGLGDQSLSFENVSGYQPSYTIVLNRDGSSGYANLVAEWYMNGGSPDTAGTFTVHADSTLFWTNKIANPAPGSQSDPQPLSFFIQQWPNNQLISLGAHLGSVSPSTTHSVLTAISGCATENFVPTPVVVVPPTDTATPTPTPSSSPTKASTPAPAVASVDSGTLADTGSDAVSWLTVAGGVVAAGLIALFVGLLLRRRSATK